MKNIEIPLDLDKKDLATIFDLIPTPSYLYKVINNDLILAKFNTAAVEITDEKISNYLGMSYKQIHKKDPQILSDFSKCLKNRESIQRKMEYNFKNLGKTRFLEVKYTFIPEDMILVQTKDITKEKSMETELKLSEEKFRIVIESLPFGVIVLDRKERYVLQNSSAVKNWGDVRGKTPEDIAQDEDTLKLWKDNNRKAFTGEVVRGDVSFKVGDKVKYFHNIISPVYMDNKVKYIIVVNIDITRRKLIEEEIIQSESNYKKSFRNAEFYKDILAHDISNILQNILLSAEIIKNQLKDTEQKDLVDLTHNVENQVYRGSNLIKNIRKLSIVQTPRQLKNLNLNENLKEIIDKFKNLSNNIRITVDNSEPNANVVANELLNDVFENILHNAIRHNQREYKEIAIRIFPEEIKDLQYVRMEFIDNARGIEDNRKEKIFQRFDKTEFGIGLGLSLAKQIIESYNGKIWVENRVKDDYSRGSKFVILLPSI